MKTKKCSCFFDDVLNFIQDKSFPVTVSVYHLECDGFSGLAGPVLMSLKPGSQLPESHSEMKGLANSTDTRRSQSRPGMLPLAYIQDRPETKDAKEAAGRADDDRISLTNGEDLTLCSPPKTENEVLHSSFVVFSGGNCLCFITAFLFKCESLKFFCECC